MTSELLPCPFCGSDNIATVVGDGCFYATCDDCMCDGPTNAVEDNAINAWNTRTPRTREKMLVEALEQALDDMGDDGTCVCPATKDLMITALSQQTAEA